MTTLLIPLASQGNYHLNIQVCIHFVTNDTHSKACGPFKEAIQFGNLTSKFQDYDFCAVWPVTDKLDFTGCRECLQAGGQEYLANCQCPPDLAPT